MPPTPPLAPPPREPSVGRYTLSIVGFCLGLQLGVCGLCVLGYGYAGSIMVHQAGSDPWVVWSLVAGAVMCVVAVVTSFASALLLRHR